MEYEKLKLHFLYVVGILVSVMIVISTGLWTDKVNFTEFLANAATMISIVLGLVAIFYSFISSSNLSQSLGNISKVSEEVVQTKSQIETFLKHADELEKKGAENTNSLREISASVENNVGSLREALGSITDKTQLLQEAVSGRFDKFENLLTETTKPTVFEPSGETINSEYATFRETVTEHFLTSSSLIGLTVAYGCVLANKANQKINLEEIGKIFSFDVSYMHGYFVAMVAADLVSHEIVEDEFTTYMVTKIEDAIKDKAKTALIEKLEMLYKKNSLETFSKYQNDIASMENLYSV